MRKRVLFTLGVVLILAVFGTWWAWDRFSIQYEESSGPVRVSPAQTVVQGDPDDFVTVVFTLYNLSDQERSYKLRAEAPQGWLLLDELHEVTVNAHAQHELFLTVQIPPGTPAGRYGLALRAQRDPDFALGRTQIAVRARERLRLALASPDLIVHPDEEKTLSLTVTNRGNVSARVSLAVTAAPGGWRFQLRESSVTLLPNHSQSVVLIVKPLPNAAIAPGRFTVQAISSAARDELSFTVVLSP